MVQRRRPRRRLARTFVKLALLIVAVLAVIAVAGPIRFVGLHCFSVKTQPTARSAEVVRATAEVKGYLRDESATYLALPEWYIASATEEYVGFVRARPPSRFPYFTAIQQYWRYYRGACGATQRVYPFDTGTHVMLSIVGVGFTIENAIKGIYENTVGRITELIGLYHTDEDAFARKTAREYAEFMHSRPWYEFPFGSRLEALWVETPWWGTGAVRKWERRLVLSVEYATKAAYGLLVRWSAGGGDGPADAAIYAWLDDATDRIFADGRIRKIKTVAARSHVVALPRHDAFTQVVIGLARQGVRFRELAANDEILVTAIAPAAWDNRLVAGTLLFGEPLLTNPAAKRIAVRAPVASLHGILADLTSRGATVERLHEH
jgi:hypothetical protein